MLTLRRDLKLSIIGSIGLTLLALTGCTALPDAGPFAHATAELRGAVVTSGTTVESELRHMQGGEAVADRFAGLWSTRVQAMNGLVEYADALQSIVNATGEARARVATLADNVARLATSAGVALPAAGSVAVATDIAKSVYGQIALARGAQSLESALEASQPAIELIANKIALDLEDARDILVVASTELHQALRVEHQVKLGFRRGLTQEREALYAKGIRELTASEEDRLRELEDMIEATDTWYSPLKEEEEAITMRLRAGEALLSAAMDGVSQWALAHRQLVIAVRERRPVNARSLAEAAADIRSLVTRVREL